MDKTLLIVEPKQSCSESCAFNICLCLKIGSLVAFTYGLMILMFYVCLQIEQVDGDITQSYYTGGVIIMCIFIVNVIFWGFLWIWGARKRETMRRQIVENQLAIIRHEEETQEQQDLEEERKMIEAKRLQRQR